MMRVLVVLDGLDQLGLGDVDLAVLSVLSVILHCG